MSDPYDVLKVSVQDGDDFEVYQCRSCKQVHDQDDNACLCCVEMIDIKLVDQIDDDPIWNTPMSKEEFEAFMKSQI
jgi:hypothetical protein